MESQIAEFNQCRSSRVTNGAVPRGMFEADTEDWGGEEDPFFNAEEIAFKVR